VLGSYISPGGMLIFVSFFSLILRVNFLGLMPYVFTPSRHLSFTLSLALPLWLGKIIFRFVKQLEHNLAHLVPEGTPAGLIPLMVIIESVSLVIRPGTLAVRLAANIVAGHLLLVLLGGQGAGLGGLLLGGLLFSLCLLVTLECAVACIQAYVFTILSSLYLREHNSKVVSLSGV
jgi:F-type H+-transporting ATPase subunit a